jgi:hypothetical protein
MSSLGHQPWSGHIGWVFVWDVVLSDADISSWHGGAIPQQGDLWGAWDLTQDYGAGTVTDQSGNGRHLTISGAAYDSGTSAPSVSYSFGSAPVPNLHTARSNLRLSN